MIPISPPDRDADGRRHDVYRCDDCGVMFSERPAARKPAADRALDLNFGTDDVLH
jgi:hypothetical protein